MNTDRLRAALNELETGSEELAEAVDTLPEDKAFLILEATLRLTVAAEIVMGAIERVESV